MACPSWTTTSPLTSAQWQRPLMGCPWMRCVCMYIRMCTCMLPYIRMRTYLHVKCDHTPHMPACTFIGRAKRAPHGWYICDFNIYINYIYIIIYGTYVGVCVTPLFFFLRRALCAVQSSCTVLFRCARPTHALHASSTYMHTYVHCTYIHACTLRSCTCTCTCTHGYVC